MNEIEATEDQMLRMLEPLMLADVMTDADLLICGRIEGKAIEVFMRNDPESIRKHMTR